jgi:hypothetical protein
LPLSAVVFTWIAGLPVTFNNAPWTRDRHSERVPGCGLTVGAMAHIGVFRIGVGFDPDRAAGAINFHRSLHYCLSMILSENRYPLFGIML